eukprot:5076368-Amphidinium_carterae.1
MRIGRWQRRNLNERFRLHGYVQVYPTRASAESDVGPLMLSRIAALVKEKAGGLKPDSSTTCAGVMSMP